jgi:adenosylmethionine-8-amino-7-oxononanoate aminotransferase
LAVLSAKDAVLVLDDGREILDAISSWWTCLHGHSNRRLIETMARQAVKLDHVLFAGATHEPAVSLAHDLLRCSPKNLARVFYSDNGSTAVEVALKIVFQSWLQRGEPQRTTFIALEHAYHGDTVGAMSVGDPNPFFKAYAPMLFRVLRAPATAEGVADALERGGRTIAGVIVEPLVQGAGGMLMHDVDVLRAWRASCTQHGVPLIADEVMVGFGRTGSLFACNKAQVLPDILCLGKGLSGGFLPLAATLCTAQLYESFLSEDRTRMLMHGHSFTANPIACAVGLESLKMCIETQIRVQFEKIGARIKLQLGQLATDSERVIALRRTGGIVALELRPPEGESANYFSSMAGKLRAAALERGVLLRPLGNVLYAMPPACTTNEQCDKIARVMAELATAEL